MNNIKKREKIEELYIFIWMVYSTVHIWSGVSALPNSYPFITTIYSIVANSTIVILFFMFLAVKKYSLANLFFYILFFLLIVLIEISIADRTLLISTMFVVNASGVNIKKLMLFDIKLKIVMLIAILLLCVCGITENTIFIINGVYKQALGFNNPNMLAAFTLTILIEWLCLHYGAIKKYQYLIIFILWYIVNYMSKARTSTYTFLIVLILFILAEFIPQIFYSNISKVVLMLLTPSLAVLSFLLSYLYMRGNEIAIMFNNITTNRIKLAAYALTRYNVKLIGQPIETIFSRNSTSSLILDNAYVYGALHYGMVYFAFLCLVYSILFIKLLKHRQINMVLLGVFYVVTGLGEKFMYTVIFNVSMLYLLYTNEQIETAECNSKLVHHKFRIRFCKR